MATVFLGNTSPREVPAGTQVRVNDEHVSGDQGEPVRGQTIVVIETPDEDVNGKKIGLAKKILEVQNAFRVHSVEGVPAWVESHDANFAQAVADEWDIKVGRPDDWQNPVAISAVPEEPKEEPSDREAKTTRDDTSFLGKVSEFLSDDKEVKEVRDES